MKATGDDALNLIRHWNHDAAPLQCTCTSEGLVFHVTGHVAELSDSMLSITGTACEALVPRDGVSYEYHGAQDIPSAIRASSGDTFVSALELRLRNGDTLIMAEVRTASSPGEQPH